MFYSLMANTFSSVYPSEQQYAVGIPAGQQFIKVY
jgi:hypothetical protein